MKYRNRKNAEATARYWNKPLDKPEWYAVEQGGDSSEILIYDVIGWPYNDASELIRQLNGITSDTIKVRINSPGGDVFDGFAIYNALRRHKSKVETVVDGLAASMATIISAAGDEAKAHKNTMYMIHEPWTFAAGNQHDFREIADLLEKMSGNLLDVYHDKVGKGKREIKQSMKEETWYTATEAKEKGFIDSVLDKDGAKAAFDLSMYGKVPDGLEFRPEGKELNEREIERALRDAGASRSFAKAIVSGNYKALRDAELQDVTQTLLKTIKG